MPEPTDLQRVAQWAKSSNAPSDVYNAACRVLDEMEAIRGGAEKLLNLSIDEGRRADKAEAEVERLQKERAAWRSMAGVEEVEAERDALKAAIEQIQATFEQLWDGHRQVCPMAALDTPTAPESPKEANA